MRFDAATERQNQAAMPDASTWLAANAGSGKTRVLTDRVARLLLAGVEPQRILCLTYTKAAASEMQNRLFKRLGKWAMLGNSDLAGELAALGVETGVTEDLLREARTLFARAIETPGGLKIQTIHSFCAAILRRFPLEAGVSPQFTEIEDRAADLLREEIVTDMSSGSEAELVQRVADYSSGDDLGDLTKRLSGLRETFISPAPDWNEMTRRFGLDADAGETTILRTAFDVDQGFVRSVLVPVLRGQSTTMIALADCLEAIAWDSPRPEDYRSLCAAFLYGSGREARAKTGSIPTKKTTEALGDDLHILHEWMNRVAAAREMELSLAAARRCMVLHDFAAAFLPEYARRKQLRGWLDFDDLILKARALLTDRAVAEWVLYRLDGGIDHILVDEAQDTSPLQWDVIDKLAQEFTSGVGARAETPRTIFVVGDKKQSIYSFQGADPDAFDLMQGSFAERLRAQESRLQDLTLEHSFRSADSILRVVDAVFADAQPAGFPLDGRHIAFKSDMPGRVDLWPHIDKVSAEDDRPWHTPLDRPSPQRETVVLARRIAAAIRSMIDAGTLVPAEDNEARGGRPVRAGDFLILVRRRSDLFGEIIRACKQENLPIAGADRLKVGAELAVKDLAALLSFLATPEDSLSLAAALRSPLFGWTEQQVFDLSHRRRGPYLWPALRDRATEFPDTMAIIDDLLGQTDFLRPYDLIERVLTRHDGRQRLLGRLGHEAEDGIDALLSQALAYERSDIPSLTGFLCWMQTDDLEIKRQMDAAGDLIRVMTVHGAKGLEAPIVILPDTALYRPPPENALTSHDDLAYWMPAAPDCPPFLVDIKAEAKARREAEALRLLYVALTRAEKWLILCSAGDLDDKAGDTWRQRVESALRSEGAADLAFEGGTGLRLENGDWSGMTRGPDPARRRPDAPLPTFARHPAPEPVRPEPTLSPSDLGGAKALPGEGRDEDSAKARGSRIHLLLERLAEAPVERMAEIGHALLLPLPDEEAAALVDEAIAVLRAPHLAALFGPGSLAEVTVSANIGGRRLHGNIDRLILGDGTVHLVDFKTNAVIPPAPDTVPEGILRQMGAYLHAVQRIYPDRRVDLSIVWTATAALMPLPHDIVTRALRASPHLDAGASAP